MFVVYTSPTPLYRLQQKLAEASMQHKQLTDKMSEQDQHSEERIDELLEQTVVGVATVIAWIT